MLAPHSFAVIKEVFVGDYFGEIGLLVNHGRYSATVRASKHTRCECAVLARTDLEKIMSTFPAFSHSFKTIGLKRLKKTRSNISNSRFTGQTEYRIVLEIIKGHKLLDAEQCVIIGEVVCRSSSRGQQQKSTTETEAEAKDNIKNNVKKSTPPANVKFGSVHRTERKRGGSPIFGNVFVINLCCHELQRLENIEFVITMYQCHSWRANSYIGEIIVYPSDVRLGQGKCLLILHVIIFLFF